jgi:hypothetical protein
MADTINMPNERKELNRPDYVEEYPYLVSWGYRRPAHLVHPPAIVQHLGYWLADLKSPQDSQDYNSDDIFRREQIFERFCKAVEDNNRFDCELRFVPIAEGSFRRRYQTCRLKSDDWHSLPVRMTLELHHEYITISTIIELPHLENQAAPSLSVVARLTSALAQLARVTTERYEELSSKKNREPMTKVREKLTSTYRDIFLDVWDEFYDQVLRKSVGEMGGEFEGVFADFRGLVAVSKDEHKKEFFTQSRTSHERTRAPRRFLSNDSIHRAHVILPFMTAEPGMAGKDEKEVTISRFLDGRCIYASTLGAQPPVTKGNQGSPPEIKHNQEPITYFVLTTGSNSWQTGRLLDRIHTLGTMRLAARRFLSPLGKAGDDLHDLERNTLKNIDTLIGKINNPTDTDEKVITDVMGRLTDASAKLFKIRNLVPGGLPYRVERSRYYRSQFKSLVIALRIAPRGRIEGFQPYDEFVERRFGSAYEFIDMVGKRFERTERQLSTLYQRVRTAEAATFQKETRREVAAIERFQEVAEYGFFLVLFMYYVGHALVDLFFPFVPEWHFLMRFLHADPKPQVEQALTFVAFLAGVAFLTFSNRRKKKKERERKERKEKLYMEKLQSGSKMPKVIADQKRYREKQAK